MAEKSKLYQKLIDKHQIISFDIFDTLLVRPYIKPSDMFFHLEKIYSLQGFAKHRITAESSAREKTQAEEINYEAIYTLINKRYETMQEKELAFEKRILQANPEMPPLFQYALENGKKVIIISDMYLSKTFLEQILNEKGYKGYFRFYLSSELGKTKSTGSLYTHVLSDLRCVPSALLHIGDNRHSDYLMPRKYGIHALHYQKLVGQLCAANKKTYTFYQKNPDSLGASILLGILANGRVSQKHENYFEQFGYEYGGAAVYAYLQWLKEQFTKDNIEEVLFVARDGYSLYKISKMYNNMQGGGGVSHYIYLPRIAERNIDSFGAYLTSIVLNNTKRIAVVDTVTGSFTAQKIIQKILNQNIIGYYWYTVNPIDSMRFVSFSEELTIKEWNIMEFIFTAPELPVKSIREGKPVYKDESQAEKLRIESYTHLFNGIMDFIKDIKIFFDDAPLFISCEDISNLINSFIESPAKIDKKEMAVIKHAADAEHTVYDFVIPRWYHKWYSGALNLKTIKTWIKKLFLHSFLPFRSIKQGTGITDIALYIPFLRREQNFFETVYYLFGFLPIHRVRK